MSDELQVGLTTRQRREVRPQDTTGRAGHPVLMTPSLVAHVEGVCADLVEDLVGEGVTTLGTHVCLSHESGVPQGEAFDVSATLEHIDGRRLRFAVEVTGPKGRVSIGTHERTTYRPRP